MKTFVVTGLLTFLAFTESKSEHTNCTDETIADIYILCDSSKSTYPVGWNTSLAFVASLIRSFKLGPDNVQFAFGIFSTEFKDIVTLKQFTNNEEFANAVLSTTQLNGNTYTYDALNAINSRGLLTSLELGARTNVAKLLIVITDGQSQNIIKTIEAAHDLRTQNITIIVVGVGSLNQVELIGIAGDDKNVFNVTSFKTLEEVHSNLTQRVCDASKEQPASQCPTQYKNDIVFLVESSESISEDDYSRNFVFITKVLNAFAISENSTRVGLIIYGTYVRVIFTLTFASEVIFQSLLDVPRVNTTTNTHKALRMSIGLFDPESGGRKDANKVLVLLTGGRSSNSKETLIAAQAVKDAGINIFCLGVTPDADEEELYKVATKPEWSFGVQNYSVLIKFANNISDFVCHAKPPPPTVKPCPSATLVDIYGVIDASGSIGADLFKYNGQFLAKLIQGFDLSERGTKFALCTFGTSVKPQWDLSADKDFILERLDHIPYQNSTTKKMHLGLLWVTRSGVSTVNRGARPVARQVVVVVTEGKSGNPDLTLQAAEELKNVGFTIIILAVGDEPDEKEIQGIASSPEWAVRVENYETLDYFASKASDIVCNDDAVYHTMDEHTDIMSDDITLLHI